MIFLRETFFFTLIGSTACSKRLTDTALNETSGTSTEMQNIPMGKCKFTPAGYEMPVVLLFKYL